jgi:hypothetical protein
LFATKTPFLSTQHKAPTIKAKHKPGGQNFFETQEHSSSRCLDCSHPRNFNTWFSWRFSIMQLWIQNCELKNATKYTVRLVCIYIYLATKHRTTRNLLQVVFA